MKKIVGILAVAAIATSLFAADVSAKARLTGNLFKYGVDKKIEVLTLDKHQAEAWNPVLSFSTSSDTAGASFKYYNTSGSWNINVENYTVNDTDWTIWFKPADIAKIQLGWYSNNLNQETIDWSNTDVAKVDDKGYALIINSGAFSLDLFAATYGAAWMAKADGADATEGTFYVKANYGADFGTINAAANFGNNFKDINAGVGYKNTFGSVNAFLNAGITMKDSEYNKARVEAFASTNIDGIGISAFIPVEIPSEGDVSVGAIAKVSCGLDNGMNVYLYINDANFLADNFAMTIKPGITGNIGGCAWEVAAEINAAEKVSFGIPCNFAIGF